ncbi:Stretch-activated cation channel Mid1 [Phaffia rhodozyma]|uniref:Stretch-activated cation channel Mid1 n=1 Tax=Phaffia rhodozyma TaxID=264483 RepID=A0A0F7SJ16_PHARH|nr:Stretch-activated cation channel Mid1 [Phaffia rhodozyma]
MESDSTNPCSVLTRPPELSRRARSSSGPSLSSRLVLTLAWACSTCLAQTVITNQTVKVSIPSLDSYLLSSSLDVPLLLSTSESTDVGSSINSTDQQPERVYLSFSFCSAFSESDAFPSIFVSNSSGVSVPSSSYLTKLGSSDSPSDGWKSSSTDGVWWVELSEGYGNWTGWRTGVGLSVAVWSNVGLAGTVEGGYVEIGVSSSGILHTITDSLPVLGDTTNSHALVFTPAFDSANGTIAQQTYPNYTLPPPVFDKDIPSSIPNQTLYVIPTSSFNVSSGMSLSVCFVRSNWNSVGVKLLEDNRTTTLNATEDGWRQQVVLSSGVSTENAGLKAGENYTLWSFTDTSTSLGVAGSGQLSGPIMFRMKQDGFPCPLVHSIQGCPTISYAAAISFDGSDPTSVVTSLPSSSNDTLTEMLASFSATLGTMACGRDMYSPISTCQDCYFVYRNWLCGSLFPRCGETPSADDPGSSTLIERTPSNPRLPASVLSPPSYTYQELLPCLETCHIVDRLCPVFLGFRCPFTQGGVTGNGTANLSYGVDLVDGLHQGELDGLGPGDLGMSADRWGNKRCALWEGWWA